MNHPTLHSQTKGSHGRKGQAAGPQSYTNSSQQTLQESVVLRVVYEQKGVKWKELTDTVTYFIAKDSLPIYAYG